jgi:hypothetical protein
MSFRNYFITQNYTVTYEFKLSKGERENMSDGIGDSPSPWFDPDGSTICFFGSPLSKGSSIFLGKINYPQLHKLGSSSNFFLDTEIIDLGSNYVVIKVEPKKIKSLPGQK